MYVKKSAEEWKKMKENLSLDKCSFLNQFFIAVKNIEMCMVHDSATRYFQ